MTHTQRITTTRVSGRRAVAHVVDGFVVGIVLGIVMIILFGLGVGSSTTRTIVFYALAIPGQFAYFVLSQRGTGRSPGKRLVGIRVVNADGGSPSDAALIRRTIPLLFEYLYIVALVAMLRSRRAATGKPLGGHLRHQGRGAKPRPIRPRKSPGAGGSAMRDTNCVHVFPSSNTQQVRRKPTPGPPGSLRLAC